MQYTKHFGIHTVEINQPNKNLSVVFVHGYGADCHDLIPLKDELTALPHSTHWLFPNGPMEVPIGPMMTGRAWFSIDSKALEEAMMTGRPKDYSNELPRGLDFISGQLRQIVDDLLQKGQKVVLGGFSQGAMLACDCVLMNQLPVQGLVLMSGALVAQERWEKAMQEWTVNQPVIFQCHGEFDPILDFNCAQKLHELFVKYEFPIEFQSFKGGHEIPRSVIKALNHYFSALLR